MEFLALIFVVGVLAAVAKIIVLAKLGVFRRLLAFDGLIDLAAGTVFGFLFFGTLTGMAIAAIAGLTFSAFLWFYRRAFGYERLERRGWRLVWVRIPPRGFRARSV